jgi:hypothetical protein
MGVFTQCIWISDHAWDYISTELNLTFTAEAYADEQNARLPRWCSLYDPFESACKTGCIWWVNMPWTDTEAAANLLVAAYERGERFGVGFILARAPSISSQTRQRVRSKIRILGADTLFLFKKGTVLFTAKGTEYTDDPHGLPDFRLFDRECKPLPWDVELWVTDDAIGGPP